MATEFLQNGLISVKNRAVYFENGTPVDPEKWEVFKRIHEEALIRVAGVEINRNLINECFSRVIDVYTGFVLRSSM